ncbi:putative preventhostdeath family protein [Leptospirillum ferrooxidans C2-3]|jgi:prevent-host-death family protein|uniref:Putative preventhostdeath family protein n=2 Tax=Leptospirillum ferrooxidans TaxID=180 RepID=I0IP42_LEPFC|nr:putative preventhostdeath family protein [Leptospirillum ferrooxidans C2-3]
MRPLSPLSLKGLKERGDVALNMMKTEIGAYEAKTKLSELLRLVGDGQSFTITNRGEPVADLVPNIGIKRKDRALAVRKLKELMMVHPVRDVNIKELILEGRK